MRARRHLGAIALLAAFFPACAAVAPPPPRPQAPLSAAAVTDHIIYAPTTWSEDLRVDRPVVVARTATLTVSPGSRIFFDIPEPAAGEDRQPWILVQGSMVAQGSVEAPISFISVRGTKGDLDDMIQFQGAKEAHFRHCVFEQGPWALHIHETTVDVLSCEFRQNYGGVRFQGGRVTLRGNRFMDNEIGVRCLKATPVIEENSFMGNRTGIFFREGVAGVVLRRNAFDNREYDLKLGEGQMQDVDAAENWWQAAQAGQLADRIYDATDSKGLGTVATDRPLAAPWGAAGGKP